MPILLLALIGVLAGCQSLVLKPPKNLNEQQGRGWTTFTRRCAACHRIKNKGGGSARDLTYIARNRSRRFLIKFLRNPRAANKRVKMPPPNLSDGQLQDLVEYLLTLR